MCGSTDVTLGGLNVSDFDFDLPPELIAQEPPRERGASRLLSLNRASGVVADHSFHDLPSLLRHGDLLVVNNTRVFPARLLGRRLPGGGAVECLLVRRVREEETSEIWEALVHPGQRLKPGSRMEFTGPGGFVHGEVLEQHFHGRRTVRLWSESATLSEAVDAIGHVPLPPYIKRADRPPDRERYQTVYAQTRGSIAAPTAGLHFTPELLASLAAARRGADGDHAARRVRHVSAGPRRRRRRTSHGRGGVRGVSRSRRSIVPGDCRRPTRHRRRYHDHADAGVIERDAGRPGVAGPRRDRRVHSSGVPVPPRLRPRSPTFTFRDPHS